MDYFLLPDYAWKFFFFLKEGGSIRRRSEYRSGIRLYRARLVDHRTNSGLSWATSLAKGTFFDVARRVGGGIQRSGGGAYNPHRNKTEKPFKGRREN